LYSPRYNKSILISLDEIYITLLKGTIIVKTKDQNKVLFILKKYNIKPYVFDINVKPFMVY